MIEWKVAGVKMNEEMSSLLAGSVNAEVVLPLGSDSISVTFAPAR